jgi:hypothetical protein
VEAISALEALANSGITRAYKIERYKPLGANIIQMNYATNATPEQKVAQPIAEEKLAVPENPENIEAAQDKIITPEAAAVESAPPAASEGLSNDDVEKLLNGQ